MLPKTVKTAFSALSPGDEDALQSLIEQGRFDPELAALLSTRPASDVVNTLLRFEKILRFKDTLYSAGELYPGPWPKVTKKGYPTSRCITDLSRLPELLGRLSSLDVRLQDLLLAAAKTRCEWNHDGLWALRHQQAHSATHAWVVKLARDRNEYRRGVGEGILAHWESA